MEAVRNLEPQWRAPNLNNQRQPPPMFGIPNSGGNNPLGFPYGTGEYIGPDSEIFRGRGDGHIFGPMSSNPQSINDPRRPPGSRFDPVDPFGGLGEEKPRNNRDFMGFN